MLNKSKKPQENFSEESSESTESSIPSSQNKKLLFLGGLLVALFVLMLSLLLFTTQKNVEDTGTIQDADQITPKNDLNKLVRRYLIEYYRPPTIEAFQETNTIYDYIWEIDDTKLSAAIQYNQNNNFINHRELTLETLNDKSLDEQLAAELVKNNTSIEPGKDWSCSSLIVDATLQPEDNTVIAEVSGSATGPIRYLFDCTGDGTIEKDITTTKQTHKAENICSTQATSGFVAVIREGGFAVNFLSEDTTNVSKCRNKWVEKNNKYEILVSGDKQSKTIRFCIRTPKSESYKKNYCIN